MAACTPPGAGRAILIRFECAHPPELTSFRPAPRFSLACVRRRISLAQTFSIAMFVACMAVCFPVRPTRFKARRRPLLASPLLTSRLRVQCEIVVFSPARRASRKLLERMQEFVVLLGMQNRIVEYNQENLRIETLEGGPPGKTTSLIRSFPSKVGVRARASNPKMPPAAGQSRRQPSPPLQVSAPLAAGPPATAARRRAKPRQVPRGAHPWGSCRVGARGGCGGLSGAGIKPACGLGRSQHAAPRWAQRQVQGP